MNENTDHTINTFFAPARRIEEKARLRDCARLVALDPLMRAFEKVIDGYMLILNEERQVIAANERFLHDMGIDDIDRILGKRPGEILDCIHVPEGPGAGDIQHEAFRGAVPWRRSVLLFHERNGNDFLDHPAARWPFGAVSRFTVFSPITSM